MNDAVDAIRYAYILLSKAGALRGTLTPRMPGSGFTAQENIIQASYIIMALHDALQGPYLRAVQAQYIPERESRGTAIALLAPRIECQSRGFCVHVLRKWARLEKPQWEKWVGNTGRSQRTLERWQGEVTKQARHFEKCGLNQASDHMRSIGILETEAA